PEPHQSTLPSRPHPPGAVERSRDSNVSHPAVRHPGGTVGSLLDTPGGEGLSRLTGRTSADTLRTFFSPSGMAVGYRLSAVGCRLRGGGVAAHAFRRRIEA